MTSGSEAWDRQYQNHPVWGKFEKIVDELRTAPNAEGGSQDSLDRLRVASVRILALKDYPSILVGSVMLTNLSNNADTFLNHVQRWSTTQNTAMIGSAVQNLEACLEILKGWPFDKEQSLRSAASAIRASVNFSAREVQDLERRVSQASEQIEVNLNDYKVSLEAVLGEFETKFDGLEQQISQRGSELSELKGNIDATSLQHDKNFQDSEMTREKDFARLLEEIESKLNSQLELQKKSSTEQRKAEHSQAEVLLAQLEEIRNSAQNVLSVVAVSATSDWYKEHADQQKRAADWMRRGAIFLFLAAFTITILWITKFEHNGDSWKETIIKASLSASLLAAAAYVVRESSNHRQEELKARAIELKLRALDPFIAPIDEEERHKIILEVAKDLFISNSSSRNLSEVSKLG